MPQTSKRWYEMYADARATFSCVGKFHRGKVGATAENILIFQFGESLEVSVLSIDNGVFEVKATAGNKNLGGSDFYECLAEFFKQEFKIKHSEDLPDGSCFDRLREICEYVTDKLSSEKEANIDIERLFKDIDFHSSITRAKFEEICADLFQSTLDPVKKALCDAKIDKANIHEIVLVGWTTNIPVIQKLLVDFLEGKELTNRSIDPDKAVAREAADQADKCCDESVAVKKLLSLEVSPHSLGKESGIEVAGGVITAKIFRTPCTDPIYFPYEHGVVIRMSGGRAVEHDNNFLGDLNLYDIPWTVGPCSPETTEISLSEQSEEESEDEEEREKAIFNLESCAFDMMQHAEELEAKARETLAWLQINRSAEVYEFGERQNELEQLL